MRYVNKRQEYRSAITAAEEDPAYNHPAWTANTTQATRRLDLPGIVQKAIDVYLSEVQPDGLVSDVGWWQNANGYTAIALKDLWLAGSNNEQDNTTSLASLLRKSAESNPNGAGFINIFNDDCCWWALCSLYVYTLTHDSWFLGEAEKVWKHMKKSMLLPGQAFYDGQDMQGAVFWTSRSKESSINAISTGLFAELSVRLALIKQSNQLTESTTPSVDEYIETSRTALSWILRTRYNASEGVVYDNINLATQTPDDRTFTYNAGVTLGTAALLSSITGDEELLTLAIHMAYKAMTRLQWVDDNGVLTERDVYGRGKNDPLQNTDGVGFKAVLVRQLGTLYRVVVKMRSPSGKARRVAAMIHSFFWINLHAQLDGNTDGEGRYGPWWTGPFEFPTNHSQMAVLDVMAAAMLVNFSE